MKIRRPSFTVVRHWGKESGGVDEGGRKTPDQVGVDTVATVKKLTKWRAVF